MSKQAESWVWDHSETTGNDRIVLVFLADQGDDDGTNSFPSMRRIADKCRINLDTVSRVISRLEARGEILVERPGGQGRGHFNRYTLVLGRPLDEVEAVRRKARDLRPFAPAQPAEKDRKGGTRGAQLGDLPTDPPTSPCSSVSEVDLSLVTDPPSPPQAVDDPNRLCHLLADLIEANGSRRPRITDAWLTDADRMLRLDERDPAKAERLIRWCQADPFWRANVLSMPTFRSKYDQLRLQANREREAQAIADKPSTPKAWDVLKRHRDQRQAAAR